MKAAVKKLQDEKDALEDRALRAQAEMQNVQHRAQKEHQQFLKYEGQSLAKEILPALDSLQLALQVEADDAAAQQLKKGIEMTYNALIKALNDHGITEIKALNEPFDPRIHQAIQTAEKKADQETDEVVSVLQAGYMIQDRVLRPAMVVVAK